MSTTRRGRRLRVQLWSYNYAPEPTGIGPVSTALAEGLRDMGHVVEVVSAHPHYPEPRWGARRIPYRESRNGIRVLRLPLWVGRATATQRIRQELTFTSSALAALPFLGTPDVLVAASPSFPALFPAVLSSRIRRVPLVIWLHDILPEGAMATGLVGNGPVLRASRWLERTAYRTASRIVVLSGSFLDTLRAKNVREDKLQLIYDPATLQPSEHGHGHREAGDGRRVICMGNIGHSQGLPPLVRAFERSEEIRSAGVQLVVTGTGVAEGDVRRQIRSDAVKMLGLISEEELDRELRLATLALVSQEHEGTEFNLPSKLMNYMAYGLPIIAAVNAQSEVARLVSDSGCGWIADSSNPEIFPRTVVKAMGESEELRRRGQAGRGFASKHFGRDAFAARFDSLLLDAVRE
ncbi:MAG: glycosyltransferase family 4 protein [Solirubrobacterales bacterium]